MSKNRITTHVITFWRVDVMSLTRTVLLLNNVNFVGDEISFEGSYDKQSYTCGHFI